MASKYGLLLPHFGKFADRDRLLEGSRLAESYGFDSVWVRDHLIASSLRGFGVPQGVLAGELQVDDTADRLGIDALDLRLRNVVRPGEEILPGKRAIDADLPADLRLLTDSLGWPDPPEGRGIGFGISASDAGAHPTSVAAVRLHADGSASDAVGATELGQGSRTVLGAGEGALNPVGSAVAAAVGRVLGCYPRELPLTPERVWRLAQTEAARA